MCQGSCGCIGSPGPAPCAGEWWACAHGGALWGSNALPDFDRGVGWPHPAAVRRVQDSAQPLLEWACGFPASLGLVWTADTSPQNLLWEDRPFANSTELVKQQVSVGSLPRLLPLRAEQLERVL